MSAGTFVGLASDKRPYSNDLLMEVRHTKRPILVSPALSVRSLD